jgi:WD40 repeat protein
MLMERRKGLRLAAVLAVAAVLLCGCTGKPRPPRTTGDFGLESTIVSEAGLRAVCWAGNGTRILATTSGGGLEVYDARTYRRTISISEPGVPLQGPSVHPGGSLVALLNIGPPTDIRIFDIMSGQPAGRLEAGLGGTIPEGACRLAWSPDGARIALGFGHGGFMVWDYPGGRITLKRDILAHFNSGNGGAMAWSPDGSRLAITDGTNSKVWDARTGTTVQNLSRVSGSCMAWSQNGTELAFISSHETQVLDTRDWRYLRNITYHNSYSTPIPDFALGQPLSPDFGRLAVQEGKNVGFYPVRLYNFRTGSPDAYLVSHARFVTSTAWSPAGDRLATASYYEIKIWSRDADHDLYADLVDRFPADPTQWNDTDGDGWGDNPKGTDPDVFPLDPNEWEDQDGDGMGDNSDPLPKFHNVHLALLVTTSAILAACAFICIRWYRRRRAGNMGEPVNR